VKRLRIAALLLFAGLSVAGIAAAQNDVPDCIDVRAIVRWRAGGYDHWVRVENGCEQRATCQVATDVNPEPQTVEIEPGAHTEVLTWRGSPARTFQPRVSCELAR
jgi:hypothetical protein